MQINLPPLPILTPVEPPPGSKPWRVDQILEARVGAVKSDGTVTLQIGRQQVDIKTVTTLRLGQSLQLQVVSGRDHPVFQLLPKNPSTNPIQRQLASAMRQALPKQIPLPQVFKLFQQIDRVAEIKQRFTTESRQLIENLVRSAPDSKQLKSADGVRQAIQKSGVFLERSIAQVAENRPISAKGESVQPIQLDVKGLLLRLLASLAKAGISAEPAVKPDTSADKPLVADPAAKMVFDQNPKQLAAKEQAALMKMPQHLLLAELTRLVEGALSRIQLNQAASVPREEAPNTPLHVELPVKNAEQFQLLQIRIEPESNQDNDDETTRWIITLSFEFAHLGRVQTRIALLGESVSASFWAEQAQTVKLFDQQLDGLRNQLDAAGLEVGRLACRQGQVPQPSLRISDPIFSEHA